MASRISFELRELSIIRETLSGVTIYGRDAIVVGNLLSKIDSAIEKEVEKLPEEERRAWLQAQQPKPQPQPTR